jgi:hypothetical protein
VNIKSVLKTSVAAAALVAVAAPAVVSPAEAGLNNGNKNSLVMSGQVSRALVYQNDGNNSDLFQVDGTDSRTRLRWIASGQMTESVTVGARIEMNTPTSQSTYTLGTAAADDTGNSTADNVWAIRHQEVTFTHKAAGKLSIGQGSVAGDGAANKSLGSFGPGYSFGSSGASTTFGSSNFANSGNNNISAVSVGASTATYDGGRTDRIRYDTPKFGGLGLAASFDASGMSSAASYAGKFGGIQVAAGGHYTSLAAGSTNVDSILGGSIAVKHDSGLSVSFSYSKENVDNKVSSIEGKSWKVGLGYAANLTNLGTTGFGFVYANAKSTTTDGDQGKNWAIGVNQNIASVGADLFLGYDRASYSDNTATSYEDFSTIFAGTRLTF